MKKKHKFMKYLCIFAIILATFVSGKKYIDMRKNQAHIEVSHKTYPVRGIDVSAHNGNINFKKLWQNKGLKFVFIKASEGESLKDKNFNLNYKKAKEAGFKIGAYHFFKFNKNGKIQAINFLQTIRNKNLDLPLVIDIEKHSNNFPNIKTTQIRKRLGEMITHLKQSGYNIIIYTNKDGYNDYIKGHFDKYPLWICSFNNPPIDEKWLFWQHSHKGKLNGYNKDIDLNVFNGDLKDWEKWLSGEGKCKAQ